MELLKPKDIHFERTLGFKDIEADGTTTQVAFKESEISSSDFRHVILAVDQRQLYGFAGFSLGSNSLLEVDPGLIELRMLKVDSNHFQKGIGTTLLNYSLDIAQNRGKSLILKPQRPGEGLLEEYRRKDYPLSTEQLREYYLRHGFRKFTDEEITDYARAIDDSYLTGELWFAGIDPLTKEMTGRSRYSMTPADRSSLQHISFDEKLGLVRNIFVKKYGDDKALESNRHSHERHIKSHLIQVK